MTDAQGTVSLGREGGGMSPKTHPQLCPLHRPGGLLPSAFEEQLDVHS